MIIFLGILYHYHKQGLTKDMKEVKGMKEFHMLARMLCHSCAYLHPVMPLDFPEGAPTSYSAKFSHENEQKLDQESWGAYLKFYYVELL